MIKNFIKNNNLECYYEANLKRYNTYRLNVKCKYLIFPKNKEELINLIKYLKDNNYKFLILGNGSNIIFSKQYYDEVIIKLDRLKNIKIDNELVEVEAGYSLIKLSMRLSLLGLSGLEFASGIPGNIGASIAMNAGAYNHSLSEIIESVKVINPNYEIVTMTPNQLDFKYRDSLFKHNKDYIIISCKLKLTKANKEEILKLISKRRVRRIETQPLNYPSAGSVFRNPEGLHAGELIEKCNLKNYKVGGAKISGKHANFIINYNNATGKNIIELIDKVKKEVKNKYNIDLILEQIIVD